MHRMMKSTVFNKFNVSVHLINKKRLQYSWRKPTLTIIIIINILTSTVGHNLPIGTPLRSFHLSFSFKSICNYVASKINIVTYTQHNNLRLSLLLPQTAF